MKTIGINGFGRIGRTVAKINAMQQRFKLALINDVNTHVDNMAYLFKYDSTYGKFPYDVSCTPDSLSIRGERATYCSCGSIGDVDWKGAGVDAVVDASGVSENVSVSHRLVNKGSVSAVVITHSSDVVDKEVIMGVNDDELGPEDSVVSNSICDANAIAHVLHWIDEEFGIETGSVTTLHPWLSYQNLVDGPAISQSNPGIVGNDYALGRASIGGLIPKNTTAMKATEKVLSHLKGKIMSFSYRIPTAIVASSDITLKTKALPTTESLRRFIESKVRESRYVKMNNESLVSVDYEREEASAIIDAPWLKVQNGLIKVVLWYDNEWGYSARVLDLVEKVLSSKEKSGHIEERELVGAVGG